MSNSLFKLFGAYLLAALLLVGCSGPPQVTAVAPTTLCANMTTTLTITGLHLDVRTVTIGRASDAGVMSPVNAASVMGNETMVTATFTANTLTPSNDPYDVVVTNRDGQSVVFPRSVTVVPGLSIAAVDPAAVWSGADFPTSVFGNGLGSVNRIEVVMAGGTPIALTGVTPVDANRVDAVVPHGLPAGTYDVTVTDTDGCSATLQGALTVVTEQTVSICAIDPIFGYAMVDTDVTITASADGTAGGTTCGGRSGRFTSTPRAWLSINGQLRALTNLAFVSAGSLTATVPHGLPVGGPYDLIVQNPDGSVGVAMAAFKVVDQPVPEITSLDPPVIPSNYNGTYKIFGRNFRSPVRVEVYGPSGMLVNVPSATVVSPTEVDLTGFDPGTLGLTVGAYVVRVTNTDQSTYGEFTAMAIISASFNIGGWTDVTSAPLPSALMREGAAAGQISLASRFMYVVGGDSGGANPMRSDATQIATLDKFGNIGSWFTARYHLSEARTSLQLVGVPAASGRGGYLYAVGGNTATATVGTVSRAKILLPEEAPQVTRAQVGLGGHLERGTFYYRVSAMLDGTDPGNPMGETLTSDEIAAHTIPDGVVTLEWMAVPHATAYRVYRTAMVNGTSATEVLLQDNVTSTTFVDDGTATAGSGTPLRPGEHGVWVDVNMLNTARRSMGLAMAHDPAGNAYLYAVGGDSGTGAAPTAAETLNTYEFAALRDDGLTLGMWTIGTSTLASARTRLQSPVGEHATSPDVAMNTAYVYAVGGWSGSGLVESYQAATVGVDGSLTWGATTNVNGVYQGLTSIAASNQLFTLGGANATNVPQKIAKSNTYTAPPVFGPTLNANSAAASDVTGAPTISSYGALVFTSAHFYLLGGTVNGTDPLPRVWSNVY